jgi:AbrB family looped-hinge helix DNA binding protein
MEKMDYNRENVITITNHGRVTIPSKMRKKFGFHDGDEVVFIEDEGNLKIIKIEPIEKLRENSISSKEMAKLVERTRQLELELENR